MKCLIATGIAVLMLTGISLHSFAQTRVTGHVFAEVVELTGAESRANSYVVVSADMASAGFDLGEISFQGKANTAYDLLVSSSSLTGSSGVQANFSAETEQDHLNYIHETGNEVIRFKGLTGDELFSSNDRQFAGNYQVIFAYN